MDIAMAAKLPRKLKVFYKTMYCIITVLLDVMLFVWNMHQNIDFSQKLKEKGRSKLQCKLTQTDNACFEKGRVS